MKQIIIENNIIDIYKSLENDKEKSQFLLKIFKFLVENDEDFKVKRNIKLLFIAIKPALKIKDFDYNFDKNWGGFRQGSGRKKLINQEKMDVVNNQDEIKMINQDEIKMINQDVNQDFSSSFKVLKNIKNISNKDDINNACKKNLQEEENDIFINYEYCKNMYKELGFSNFDLERFYVFYKDKGLLKKDVENKMIQWDMRHKENNKNNKKDLWDINISDELMKKAEIARRQAMGGNNG